MAIDRHAASRRVAVIYPFLAHYREAIFRKLSAPEAAHRYVVFADRQGNPPSVATIPPSKSRDVSSAGTLNWHFIRSRWITPAILWQSHALRLAAGRDFDVLILLGDAQFLSSWLAAIIGRARGKRVLMWTHGILRRESGLRGWIRRAFYGLADGLLLYGHRARDLLMEQGFDGDDLYVVYNSLDSDRQNQIFASMDDRAAKGARQSLGLPDDASMLLSVGRLVAGKELDVLIRAAAQLRLRGLTVHLAIIGGGEAKAGLEELATVLSIGDRVHFIGEIYAEEELAPYIYAADICVSPGGVGLTAMHALVYGTPVITHDVIDAQKPECEAIRTGVSGAFFRRGDGSHLADVIQDWLQTAADREEVRAQCRAGLLSRYTPDNQRTIIDKAVAGVPAAMIPEMQWLPPNTTFDGGKSRTRRRRDSTPKPALSR